MELEEGPGETHSFILLLLTTSDPEDRGFGETALAGCDCHQLQTEAGYLSWMTVV